MKHFENDPNPPIRSPVSPTMRLVLASSRLWLMAWRRSVKLLTFMLFESGDLESARRSIMDRRTAKPDANRHPPEVDAPRAGRHAYLIRIAADRDQERAL